MSKWNNIQHFKPSEFDSPDVPGSGQAMDGWTLFKLDGARQHAGVPFRINSGYRTKEHNREVGGVEGSAHTRGFAADISLEGFSAQQELAVIVALARFGFKRMGWSPGRFIHVDDDPDKPEPAYWQY